jgi:hypothetical protein
MMSKNTKVKPGGTYILEGCGHGGRNKSTLFFFLDDHHGEFAGKCDRFRLR